jgi:hypothetical protein
MTLLEKDMLDFVDNHEVMNEANRPASPLTMNDPGINIELLRHWLDEHKPREHWSMQQWKAYNDRLASLARWIAKAQQEVK